MTYQRSFSLIAITTLFGFAIATTSADEITLTPVPGYPTGASINALAGPLFDSDIDITPVPGPGTGSASASKFGNTATHTYGVELDYSMSPAFFDSSYSGFVRTATEGKRASAESKYHFTVDVPTVYEVMGFFSVTDESGTTIPGNVELEVELLDITDPFDVKTILYNWQKSESTMDEMLMIGGTAGDTVGLLEGSIMGELMPGKMYSYRTLVTTNAIDIDGGGPLPATDGGATASGAQTILFAPIVPVPEPGTFAIVAGIGLLLAFRRRR